MTSSVQRPSRPVLKPLAIVIASIIGLIASGVIYSMTGWVWLGALNLVLLIVGGLTLIWLVVVLLVLAAGTIAGRRRR